MRNKIERRSSQILLMTVGLLLLGVTGCSAFRATGQGVKAVGAGAGTAIEGTGEAIMQGADDTAEDLRR